MTDIDEVRRRVREHADKGRTVFSIAGIKALLAELDALRDENEKLNRYKAGLQVLATTFYKDDQYQEYAKHILDRPLADTGGAI